MFYINKLIVRQIDMILKWFVDNTMIFLLKNWVVLNFCSWLYIRLDIIAKSQRDHIANILNNIWKTH